LLLTPEHIELESHSNTVNSEPKHDVFKEDDEPDEEQTPDLVKYTSATLPPQAESVYNFSTNPPSNEGALSLTTHSSAGDDPEEEHVVDVVTVLELTKFEQLLSEPYELTNKVPLVEPLIVQLFITYSLLSL